MHKVIPPPPPTTPTPTPTTLNAVTDELNMMDLSYGI